MGSSCRCRFRSSRRCLIIICWRVYIAHRSADCFGFQGSCGLNRRRRRKHLNEIIRCVWVNCDRGGTIQQGLHVIRLCDACDTKYGIWNLRAERTRMRNGRSGDSLHVLVCDLLKVSVKGISLKHGRVCWENVADANSSINLAAWMVQDKSRV